MGVSAPPPPGRFEGTLIGLPMVTEAKCTVTLPDGTPYSVPVYLAFDGVDGVRFRLDMDSLYRELKSHPRKPEQWSSGKLELRP